jgi:microcystin-dependent protein
LVFGPDGIDDEQIVGKPPPSTRFLNWLHTRVSTNRPEDTHHRLGYGPTEAAPGNHTHDGRDSLPISVTATLPVGLITPWFTDDIPEWGLELNGQAVSRATYHALWLLWGETFGSGDGESTFNVPKMDGRVMVGVDALDAEFDTLGETGGAKTVSHSHPLSDAGQAQVQVAAQANTAVYLRRVSGSSWTSTHRTSNANGAGSTAESSSSGAALMGETDDASVSTLQPYIVTRFVVVSGVLT